jgi:hypothetical protein
MEEYVEKNYRFIIDLKAKVKKSVEGNFDKQTLNFMQQFIEAFLRNPNALLEYFKQYFIDLLVNGACYSELLDYLDAKRTEDIAIFISEEMNPEAAAYIVDLYSPDPSANNIVNLFSRTLGSQSSAEHRVDQRHFISDQFLMPEIIAARFIECNRSGDR